MEDDHDSTERKPRRHSKKLVVHTDRKVVNYEDHSLPLEIQDNSPPEVSSRSQLKRIKLVSARGQKKKKHDEPKTVKQCEDEDYLLETIHNLQKWMKKTWNWAKCFTQYCYPGLRTIEYYKKIKDQQQCKNKLKIEEDKKRKGTRKTAKTVLNQAALVSPEFLDNKDNTNIKMSEEIPKIVLPNNATTHGSQESNLKMQPPTYIPNEPIPNLSEDLCLNDNEINPVSSFYRTFSMFLNDDTDHFHPKVFFKWACVLFVPMLVLLGTHYRFLKGKYEILSENLMKAKEENLQLSLECENLERLLEARQLKLPFPTSEQIAKLKLEWKILSENTFKSKNEISQLSLDKEQLIEELEEAEANLNQMRSQYDATAKKRKTAML